MTEVDLTVWVVYRRDGRYRRAKVPWRGRSTGSEHELAVGVVSRGSGKANAASRCPRAYTALLEVLNSCSGWRSGEVDVERWLKVLSRGHSPATGLELTVGVVLRLETFANKKTATARDLKLAHVCGLV